MCMLFFASTPRVASLKPSTTSGTSSGLVVAAGSSIWIQSAPAATRPFDIRADDVGGDVVDETAACVVAVLGRGAEASFVAVVLVVGPVLHRVGAGQRDLHDPVGVRTDELELLHVLRARNGRRLHDGRLCVVLVVEGAHDSARLEAVSEGSDMVVHLRPLLLAVVDDVEANALEQADRVDRGPVVYFRQVEAPASQSFDECFVALDLEPATPIFGRDEIALVERPAGERLHPPGRLGEAADLAGDKADAAHANTGSSVAACPSQASF